MATTSKVLVTPGPDGAGDPTDPYRYGWRYVCRTGAAGRKVWEQVPLTLEDVLHPQEGDFVIQNAAHARRCRYLADIFEARLAANPTAVVLNDVRIAWDVAGLKPHGPDIAVILGVRERQNWSTFDVAAEGVRPALIVEVVSPETARLDRSTKLREYARAGVPLYVIVDTVRRRRQPILRLLGYALTPGGEYQPLAPDERGRLWLEPARTWLGVADDEIVCSDEAGQPLGDYRALAAALAVEHQARTEAEQRAEADRQVRDEAERQAEADRQARTEAERRAAAAEVRLRELEAEVRRLRGEAS